VGQRAAAAGIDALHREQYILDRIEELIDGPRGAPLAERVAALKAELAAAWVRCGLAINNNPAGAIRRVFFGCGVSALRQVGVTRWGFTG